MASLTLTSPPSIMSRLVTEPVIEEAQEHVVATMAFGFPGLGSIFDSTIGQVVNAARDVVAPAIGVVGVVPSIPDIIRAIQAGQHGTVMDHIAQLGFNTPDFYCVVGAIAAGQAAAPAHIIMAQAREAHREFPTLWYVNIPHNISRHDAEELQRSRRSMTNFRSWSSKKWWEEVGRRYGVADEAVQRARQSREFAQIACEDMVQMSWLRTTRPPNNRSFTIDCEPQELHERLVRAVMDDWSNVDNDVVETLEPIFQDMVRAASNGSVESSQMNNVVMEKYVYSESTRSTTSYIRLLSFEMHEAVYAVIRGKRQERQPRINVQFTFSLYEAIFEASLWEQFSATLHEDDTDLLLDYVYGQTIDLRPALSEEERRWIQDMDVMSKTIDVPV